MKHDHETLWYLIDKMADIADMYQRIKNDDSEKDSNTRLGLLAVKYNIIFFIFLGGATALGIWSAFLFKSESTLLGIGIVLLAAGVAITSVVFGILAFTSEICQMKLNKKPIGVVSLLSTFAIILAAVAAVAITVVVAF